MSDTSVDAIFQTKYDEFAVELKAAFPELSSEIDQACQLSSDDRMEQFKTSVFPNAGRPARSEDECPGYVLPGVKITDEIWLSTSQTTKKAVHQYLGILSFSFAMKDGLGKDWADKFMDQWRSKMKRADFDSFAKKMTEMFGSGGDRLPPFPDRLKNGRLAKLAEEIVKELKPEELGLDPEMLKRCEADPSQAFEILMGATMKNPEKLQNAMKRIIKRLQDKFQRGEFKPQELVAEAEEMMKEFSENPAFVEMMEAMRSTFGFEDMDMARASGNEGSARLSIARQRLRRKLDAKNKKK